MKRILFIISLILATNSMFANPTDMASFKVVQPNGDSITIVQHGDEYGIWYETLDGYVVEKNTSNYWVYVNTNTNDNLVLTNQIVNNVSSPTGINLTNIFNTIDDYRMNIYEVFNNDSIYRPDLEDEETVLAIQQGKEYDIEQAKAPAKNKGTINVLTILIQFQDVKFEQPTAVQNYFDRLMNDEDFIHPNNQNNITGSVREYWEEASYGQLSTNTTVVGPYTANNNIEYYRVKRDSEDGSINASKVKRLVKEAIKAAAKDVNMQLFDNNNNGFVDFVHIVFAGTKEDIWPHQSAILGVVKDWVWVSKYIITPEKENNKLASIGTICHEMGHAFGAPDFYDVNYGIDGEYPGLRYWDLMAWGGYNNNKNSPAHPNPYIKTKIFEWANATELSGNDRLYKLRPSELDANSIYKISTATPDEYYLLENRQDSNLNGTGLLIYHIHSNITTINFWLNNFNKKHPQKVYIVDANNNRIKPNDSVASYGKINSDKAPFRSTHSKNMYFTSESLPSNCDWNGNTTYNKDVCFISEEEIDGEMCVKFVLNPEIDGPDVLCDSAIYSLKHIPSSNVTIEWTYTRPSGLAATTAPLTIGTGQGTRAVCFKRGSYLTSEEGDTPVIDPEYPFVPAPTSARGLVSKPYSGFIEIQAKVTLNGETKIWRKTIYMPHKVEMNTLNLGTINYWTAGTTKTITLKSPTDLDVVDDIEWYIELPGETPYYAYGSSITVTPTNGGTARFTATYTEGCDDEYKSDTKTYSVIKWGVWTYTNPASGSVEINVMNGDAPDESGIRTMSVNSQPTPYMGAYRVELWHDVYGKVREMDVPENTPTVTMSLEGVNSGVYVMRLIIDNQVVEASQLIVK